MFKDIILPTKTTNNETPGTNYQKRDTTKMSRTPTELKTSIDIIHNLLQWCHPQCDDLLVKAWRSYANQHLNLQPSGWNHSAPCNNQPSHPPDHSLHTVIKEKPDENLQSLQNMDLSFVQRCGL